MDARNFTYMFFGFLAAWMIVLVYVISLVRRSARLKRELEDVKSLVASNQSDTPARRSDTATPLEDRVR